MSMNTLELVQHGPVIPVIVLQRVADAVLACIPATGHRKAA